MKIIGLDLSLTSTGVCVATHDGAVTDRVTSKGKATATLEDRYQRIARISGTTVELAGSSDVDLVVIEAPAMSRTTGHQHDRSGLWWQVVTRLKMRGIPVAEVAPTARAKYATGRGNAAKDDVLSAVVRRYAQVDVNGNDEADALVLAAMGMRWAGFSLEVICGTGALMPKAHLEAMAKVAWPQSTGAGPRVGAA